MVRHHTTLPAFLNLNGRTDCHRLYFRKNGLTVNHQICTVGCQQIGMTCHTNGSHLLSSTILSEITNYSSHKLKESLISMIKKFQKIYRKTFRTMIPLTKFHTLIIFSRLREIMIESKWTYRR